MRAPARGAATAVAAATAGAAPSARARSAAPAARGRCRSSEGSYYPLAAWRAGSVTPNGWAGRWRVGAWWGLAPGRAFPWRASQHVRDEVLSTRSLGRRTGHYSSIRPYCIAPSMRRGAACFSPRFAKVVLIEGVNHFVFRRAVPSRSRVPHKPQRTKDPSPNQVPNLQN